jgi:UDP:flavonoid glycosyltransferase YjiC (YdhE family)
MMDQPYWGQRVVDLGVGPRMIPRKRLTAARLTDALRQATQDQTMKRKAAELGAAIRAETGVENGVRLIEACLDRPQRPVLARPPHFQQSTVAVSTGR